MRFRRVELVQLLLCLEFRNNSSTAQIMTKPPTESVSGDAQESAEYEIQAPHSLSGS